MNVTWLILRLTVFVLNVGALNTSCHWNSLFAIVEHSKVDKVHLNLRLTLFLLNVALHARFYARLATKPYFNLVGKQQPISQNPFPTQEQPIDADYKFIGASPPDVRTIFVDANNQTAGV